MMGQFDWDGPLGGGLKSGYVTFIQGASFEIALLSMIDQSSIRIALKYGGQVSRAAHLDRCREVCNIKTRAGGSFYFAA